MYRTSSRYGWNPDLPDHRDLIYSVQETTSETPLPSQTDLRNNCPPVYDQGQLNSCTANAIAGAFQFELMKQNLIVFAPSRLFIYYNERVIENTVDTDHGAQIRDGFKTIGSIGVCPETSWPYIISEYAQKPFSSCYTDALNHKAVSYYRVSRVLNEMKACLVDRFPFVIGFTVYSSFEGTEIAKTGILNMPLPGEKVVGGHAVLVVGYDDNEKSFIVRNSWGSDWGKQGYFTMPYDYLLNEKLSDDFWTLRLVTNNPSLKRSENNENTLTKSVTKKVNKKNKSKALSLEEPSEQSTKLTIDGKFIGSTNNACLVSVISLDPSENYDYSPPEFYDDFNINPPNLISDHSYEVIMSGHTAGTFDCTISGDFQPPNPIKKDKVTNGAIGSADTVIMN